MSPNEQIEAWAALRGLPWMHPLQPPLGNRVRFALINGGAYRGEVMVALVGETPPSYFVETCDGDLILEETWADEKSLSAMLDDSFRIIRRRHPHADPGWMVDGEG